MQPCWSCKNYAGGCSWSESFEPVQGWDAQKVVRVGKYSYRMESYKIKSCPLYEADERHNPDFLDLPEIKELALKVLNMHRCGMTGVKIRDKLDLQRRLYSNIVRKWKERKKW